MAAVSGAALEPLGAALGSCSSCARRRDPSVAPPRTAERRDPARCGRTRGGAAAAQGARRRRAAVDDELGDDCAALDARLAPLRAGVEEGPPPVGAAVAPPPPPAAAAEAPTDDDGDDTNDALLLALKEQIRDVKRQMKRLETRRGAGAKARKK